MRDLLHDLRYALRTLRRAPGFAAVTLVTLALGIGANTAVFTVVNSVLLTPLAYPQPERLVLLWESKAPERQATNVVSPGNYLDWRDRARSFAGLAALTWSELTLTGDTPEVLQGRAVTANFFDLLGVRPELGRTFTEAEDRPGGARVIVIRDELWRRRFGADRSVVGRVVPADGGAATVIGVMPPSVRPMPWGDEEYWEPMRLDGSHRERRGRYAMVLGRLRPGASPEAARAEMDGIAGQLAREYPAFDTGWGVNVVGLTDQLVGGARPVLLALLGAVALVLLIACANVANLFVGRALGRRRERSVRAALGASRWRLARHGLVESLLLSLAGGLAGVQVARWTVALLLAAHPAGVPRIGEIRLDPRVLGVTAIFSLLAAIAFGLVADVAGPTIGLGGALREADHATPGRGPLRMRRALVVVQVALALVLLAGSGLLVRSIRKLAAIDPGFDPAHLLTIAMDLPAGSYADPARQDAFYDRLLERIRGLPGVHSAAAVDFLPLTAQSASTTFTVVGRPAPAVGEAPTAEIRSVDPDYFRTMRIPLVRGRAPASSDRAGAPPVIVVNRMLARQSWPGEDPIGHRLKVSWAHPDQEREVIGVAGDVRGAGLDAPIRPRIYFPRGQAPTGSLWIVVRHSGDRAALVGAIRRAVREIDRNVPVPEAVTMYAHLQRSMADRRYPMLLLGAFAVLALVLATVGLYGVLAYAVGERRREIGIRLALGARPVEVLNLVVAQGLQLVGVGTGLGLASALLATRVLRSLLFQVTPADPTTLLAAVLGLTAVGLLATVIPAHSATRVDPNEVLRDE